MRLTRSRSRSQTRASVTQQPSITTTTVITVDRKRRPIDQPHNGYTAEEEDQASKFLKIDEEEEEDEQHDQDVEMQPGTELSSKKRSRSRSKSTVDAAARKKQKEQQPSVQQLQAVQPSAPVAASPQPSPSISSTPISSSASRPSLQPPSRNSSGSGSSSTQRSRSHSSARPSTAAAYISPELLGGGGATFTPASSTSSAASLQPPASAAAKRRPSVPNLPSQTRTSSSASSSSSSSLSSSTSADAESTEFKLQLTLERLSQLRRQLDGVEGAAEILDLLQQVEGVAYKADQPRAASVSRLSAVHNQLLSAMRQLAEQTAGGSSSVNAAFGRLLDKRIVPRSVASIVSSRSLLSHSLPALITTDLPLAHKLLLINPAAVHQKDADGFTALHYAVLSHDLPLIAYLCDHGANPAIQNNEHTSPLSLARLNSLDTSTLIKHPAARCSRAEGGLTNQRQDFWNCITCGLAGERGCCDVCSVRCHKGHVLQRVMAADDMCNEGYCDCCDTGACQASSSTQSEQQQAASAVDAAAAVLSSEEDGVFSTAIFSTAQGIVSTSSARAMLRLMEDVVVSSARLMRAAGGDEQEEAEAAVEDDESITWKDVWQASALTAVLTLSFYALFGGAPDIVKSATPAVHWLQDRWQLLTAAVTALTDTSTKH